MFDISQVGPGRWYAWIVTPCGGWAHEWPSHAQAAAWVRGMWAIYGNDTPGTAHSAPGVSRAVLGYTLALALATLLALAGGVVWLVR